MPELSRRQLFKNAVAGIGVLGMSNMFKNNLRDIEDSGFGLIPKRPYGNTGVKLSVIGFGGIVVMNAEQSVADKVVADAVERGINYFDVAPSYGDAELKLGPALEPYRKDIFLACKTTERTKEGARAEFKRSLKNMRTDYFDLYQLHAITDVKNDVDVAFAKGGAMELAVEAKKNGQIRHLGFSAHSHEAALEAMDRYDFDSILFPINFATFYKNRFGPAVIERAKEKSMAVLALKSMACRRWPKNDPLKEKYSKCWYQPLTDPDDIRLALSFTLSQPVTALIPPGEEELFRLALDMVADCKPLTVEENKKLIAMASGLDPIFPL
ncbi:MAG: aldo/keto reductase [Sedimentisphaerales bacterium]|nr:aldo/keto reductase [Sedimentisphaerales bacterium]